LPPSAPIRETASVIGYSANQARITNEGPVPFLQSRLIPADSYSAIQCFFKRSFVIIHLQLHDSPGAS
jgi:hypothetical protein